jgi:pantoate--beta-alanine ligase
MRALSSRLRRQGRRIAFVPTMGYLHEGHLSLIRRARRLGDVVVVSIFVNPTQFGPGEDLSRYPRDMERDRRLCRREAVHILFCPSARAMYAPDHSVYVEEKDLSAGLCGAFRPTHFRGVATVVAKLFNIVQPDVAVFGRKDAQQAAVVERMARDLNFGVKIVVAPIVREPDGLAMSSRNTYLSAQERRSATRLNQALILAERICRAGTRSAAVIRNTVTRLLAGVPGAKMEYVELVDAKTLKPVEHVARPVLLALAVRFGKTRLIDNRLIRLR